MSVYLKSRWNGIHFNVSPFDTSTVSPYLNVIQMYEVSQNNLLTSEW